MNQKDKIEEAAEKFWQQWTKGRRGVQSFNVIKFAADFHQQRLDNLWKDVSEKPEKDKELLMWGLGTFDSRNMFHFGCYRKVLDFEGLRFVNQNGEEVDVIRYTYLSDLTLNQQEG